MTGRIIQAFHKLKSYVIRPNEVDDENVHQGILINHQNQNSGGFDTNGGVHQHRSLSTYFPFVNSRKRRAEQRVAEFDVEITDDEDDPTEQNGGWSQRSHLPKRFRPTELGNIFSGENSPEGNNSTAIEDSMAAENRRYVTRGSGIDPAIKGLDKQPWMFNFKSKKSLRKCNDLAVVDISRGTLYGKDSNQPGSSSSQIAENSPHETSSSLNKGDESSDCFRNFRFKNKQKEIEVITLDDEVKEDSVLSGVRRRPSSRKSDKPVNADANLGVRLSTPMKTKRNFSSSLNRLTTADVYSGNTIRLREKMQYTNLLRMQLKSFNVFGSMVSNTKKFAGALQRTKLSQTEMTAKYYNFESPSVKFIQNRHGQGSDLPYSYASSFHPQLPTTGKSCPNSSISASQKNTPASTTPELIDLSFEDEEEPTCSKALVVVPPNGLVGTGTPQRSFHDLNEALHSNLNSECTENSNDSPASENLLAIQEAQDSEVDEDPDISVISKSVLERKPRSRRLNSLALEHEDVPYTSNNWLVDMSSSWREEQKHRQKQILENLETMDVLQKESTIEKDLRERMRKKLTLTEIIVLEEPPPSFPEITAEMQQIIDNARRPGYESDVLATVFSVDVTRGDIKTLAPCKWLNDNVINVYMELISQRSKKEKSYPTVYPFSTFFYPKLIKEGYSNALKRWTRKVDIFAHDLLVVPIHLGLHWCLACVDFRNKTIKYYDSLGGRNDKCLHALLNYVASERKERKSQMLNKDEWTLENVDDIPQQQNGSDCGMFSCKFAEYLSRDAELTFAQENMNYYRERMIYEIIKSDLLYP